MKHLSWERSVSSIVHSDSYASQPDVRPSASHINNGPSNLREPSSGAGDDASRATLYSLPVFQPPRLLWLFTGSLNFLWVFVMLSTPSHW